MKDYMRAYLDYFNRLYGERVTVLDDEFVIHPDGGALRSGPRVAHVCPDQRVTELVPNGCFFRGGYFFRGSTECPGCRMKIPRRTLNLDRLFAVGKGV